MAQQRSASNTMENVKHVPLQGVAVIALTLTLLAGCNRRKGDIVYIPRGYEGWVRIEYEEKASSPLEMQHSKYVVRVPTSGVVRTSTIRDVGYASDEYYFLSSNGEKTAIPEEVAAVDPQFCETHTCVLRPIYRSVPDKVTFFFVGPKSMVS